MFKKKKQETIIEQPKLVETLEDVELKNYDNLLTKEDFIYTINRDEETCTIHKLLKVYPRLIIPETVDGHMVTVLENKESESIFEDVEGIVKDVVIPNTIKTIGKHCFNECKNVNNFYIGENVELLDVGCFSYCEGITDIILPESVKMVSDYAFRNCKNLQRITFKGKDTDFSKDPYVITNAKNQFNGTIFAPLESKAQEYAELYIRNFEEWKYVKLEAKHIGIRPTEENNYLVKGSDFEVYATWSNTVVDKITDFDLRIENKENSLDAIITFLSFNQVIILSTLPKEIIDLNVEYIGKTPRKTKTPLTNEEFKVIAIYDNKTELEVKDFIIENPKLLKGNNAIHIIYKTKDKNCLVIGKKGFLWF